MAAYLADMRRQDYASALLHLETAQGLIALIPDSEREDEGSIKFRPEAIEQAIRTVKRKLNQSAGIVNMEMKPTRDYEVE
ncbi:MAG: hypothetical protein AAFX06_14885 [Planctomycetota bacterium]